MFKQCTHLEVIEPFYFRPNPKGRAVECKLGDIFTITSPDYKNSVHCLIDRVKKAKLNIGYQLDNSDIQRFFKVVE